MLEGSEEWRRKVGEETKRARRRDPRSRWKKLTKYLEEESERKQGERTELGTRRG